jgi:preprotein translocase subunit SecE
MAMNREQKRMLQRQGELGPDGETPAPRRDQRPGPRPQKERTKPAEFAREVRGELRKVAWPTREEVIRFSMIVLVTIVVLTIFVSFIDYLSSEGILLLFEN